MTRFYELLFVSPKSIPLPRHRYRFLKEGGKVRAEALTGMALPIEKPVSSKRVSQGKDHEKNNFTAIRIILASLVIFCHSAYFLDGDRSRDPLTFLFGTIPLGELAVDGFFIVSGYLLVNSWARDPNLPRFMMRRALRIYPGFLVAFALSAIAVGKAVGGAGYFHEMYWKKLAVDAVTLGVPETPPTFVGTPYPFVNGSLWTIRPEFTCYILLAIIGITALGSRKWFWPSLWIASVGFYGYLLCFANFDVSISYVRFFTYFAAGAAMASLNVRTVRYAIPLLIAVTVAMFWQPSAQLGLALGGAALILTLAFSRVPILGWLSKLPDVSYGIYLYAWPIQKLTIYWWPKVPIVALNLITLALSIVFGYLSWTLIEKPFLKFKPKSLRTAVAT